MNLTLLASLRRFAFKTGGKQEIRKDKLLFELLGFFGPEIVCTLLVSKKKFK